jgi:hypothetical protein
MVQEFNPFAGSSKRKPWRIVQDRSSRRMSQGQRTAESEIEEAKSKTVSVEELY